MSAVYFGFALPNDEGGSGRQMALMVVYNDRESQRARIALS